MVLFSKCGSGMVSYPYTLNEIRSTNGFEMSPVAVDNTCARKSQRLLAFLAIWEQEKRIPNPASSGGGENKLKQTRKEEHTKLHKHRHRHGTALSSHISAKSSLPLRTTSPNPLMPNTKNQEPKHKKTEKYLGKSPPYLPKQKQQSSPPKTAP